MSMIIVTIEITGVDEWEVDWANKSESALMELSIDIQKGVSSFAGIDISNLNVELELKS